MPAYSTTVQIPAFAGIDQTGDGYNKDLRYATEMENVDVHNGQFKPFQLGKFLLDGPAPDATQPGPPIGTLACLSRRYGGFNDENRDLLIAFAGGHVYAKTLKGDDPWIALKVGYLAAEEPPATDPADPQGAEEEPAAPADPTDTTVTTDPTDPDDLTEPAATEDSADSSEGGEVPDDPDPGEGGEEPAEEDDYDLSTAFIPTTNIGSIYFEAAETLTLSTDYNSFVTYETSIIQDEGTGEPIDIFLFSNGTDGMYCLYGTMGWLVEVPTPDKFSIISRHNERIWGTGIANAPDTLWYSCPYDPFDWNTQRDPDNPADNAGAVLLPSWDGDSFLGLAQYGSQLLAFKRNAIWKIIGTDPGEFVIREQFGPGTVIPASVAVSGSYAFMLGYTGIVRYDGAQSGEFLQDNVVRIFNRVNHDVANSTACAVLSDRTYLLALPIDGSTVNNALLAYDSREGTFTLRTGIFVRSFLAVEDKIFYTSAKAPGKIFELCDEGHALPVYWESGMQDLGVKSSVKSAFMVYFLAEAATPFNLVLGIQTDKKLKTKMLTVKPGKATKIAINVQGRFFKLILSSRTIVPFKLVGGIKIDMELDPD